MYVRFVDLAQQDAPIRHELQQAALGVLERGDYILGSEVESFEDEFARYCGTRFAVGVSSGLAALELILRAMDIGPGDEVIVPSFTFTGTAAAVALAGARPVFADVDDTYTIDPAAVLSALTPKTKAVIAVHLYGTPADMGTLSRLLAPRGVYLIEDAAQAHGATLDGRRVGSLSDAAAFSFYPSKNLGASGDAGAVTTDDADLAARLRALRNCGQFEKNVHALMPCNHRLDTLQAALLRVRLRSLEGWNVQRRRAAEAYRSLLKDSPVDLPMVPEAVEPVWHLFVVRSDRRDELASWLNTEGIGTGVHYPIPVHLQPFFSYLGHQPGDFPRAEEFSRTVLSLPMHPTIGSAAIEHVAQSVAAFTAHDATSTTPQPARAQGS